MAEIASWVELVADALFQLLDLRESAVDTSIPKDGVSTLDRKDSPDITRANGYPGEILFESAQEFLSHPTRSQEPFATGAVGDGDGRFCGFFHVPE